MRYIFIGKNSKGISKQGDGHQGLGHLQKVHTFSFYHIFKQAIAFWVVFAFTKYHCTPIVVSFSLAHIYIYINAVTTQQFAFHKNSRLILDLESHYFQEKIISFWQINHFNKNCNFHFAQTWFSTINAGFIHYKFDSKCYFEFWKLRFSKQIAVFILDKLLGNLLISQHKIYFALTLVFLFQQTGVYNPAKHNLHPSYTQFLDCQR